MEKKSTVLYSTSKELSSCSSILRVDATKNYFVYYNSEKNNLLLYTTTEEKEVEIPNVLQIIVDGSIELLFIVKEDLLCLLFYSKSQSIIQLVLLRGTTVEKIHLFNSPFPSSSSSSSSCSVEIINLKLFYSSNNNKDNSLKLVVVWSIGVVQVVSIVLKEEVIEKEYYRLGGSGDTVKVCCIVVNEDDDVIVVTPSKEYLLWRDCARITKDNNNDSIKLDDDDDDDDDSKVSVLRWYSGFVSVVKSITTTSTTDTKKDDQYDFSQIEFIKEINQVLFLTRKGKLYKKGFYSSSSSNNDDDDDDDDGESCMVLLDDQIASLLLEKDSLLELHDVSCIKKYSNDSILLFLNKNKYVCIISNDFSKLEYFEEISTNENENVIVDYVSTNASGEDGKLYFVTKTCQDKTTFNEEQEEEQQDKRRDFRWFYMMVYSFFLFLFSYFFKSSSSSSTAADDEKDSPEFTFTLWKLWKSTPQDLLLMMVKEERFSDAHEFAKEYGLDEQQLMKQEYISSSNGGLKLLENIQDDEFVFESIAVVPYNSKITSDVEECYQNELARLQYGLKRFSTSCSSSSDSEKLERIQSLVEYLETSRLLCSHEAEDLKNFVAFYKYYRQNGSEGLQQHAMYFARESSKKELFGLIVQRHFNELKDKRMDLLESIVEVELLEYKDTILQLWSQQDSTFKEWILEKCVQIDEQSGQIDLSFDVYKEFVLKSSKMDQNGRIIKLVRDLVFSGHLITANSNNAENKSILRSLLFASGSDLDLDLDLERLKFLYSQLEVKKRDSLIFSIVCKELDLSENAIEKFTREQSVNEPGLLLEYLRHYCVKAKDQNDFIDSLLHSNQVIVKDSSLSVLKEIRKLYPYNSTLNSLITLVDAFKLYSYSLKKLYESSKESRLTKLLSFYKQENDLYSDYKYIKEILQSDEYYLEYLKALLLSKNDKKISIAQTKLKEYHSAQSTRNLEEHEVSSYFFLNIYLEYYNNSNSFQDELLRYARRILKFGIKILGQAENDIEEEEDALLLQELRYLDAVCRIFGGDGFNNNNSSSSMRALLPSQVRLASEERRLKMINLSLLAGSYRSKDDLKALIDDYLCNAKKDSSQLPIMFKFNLMLCKFYDEKKDFKSVSRIISEIMQEYKQTVQYPSEFFRIVAESMMADYDFDLLSQTISLFYGQSEHDDYEVIDELLDLCDEHQNVDGYDDPKYECLSYLAKGLQDLNDITVKHLMKTNWAEISEFVGQ